MNKRFISLLIAGSLAVGLGAAAQDTPVPSAASSDNSGKVKPMSRHQMMKECMARESAKNDGSTKAQMRKTCKVEVKSNAGAQDMMKH